MGRLWQSLGTCIRPVNMGGASNKRRDGGLSVRAGMWEGWGLLRLESLCKGV